MRIRNTSTPVFVLRAEHYGSLGILRSLSRQGIQTCIIDGSREAPAFASRYSRGGHVVNMEDESGDMIVEQLINLGKRMRTRAILLPTTDEMALLVVDHADRLRQHFVFPEQNRALIHALFSKKEMYLLAKANGVPVPTTFFPQSRRDVLQSIQQLSFPIFLKGINGGLLERRTGKKAAIAQNAGELFRLYDAMEEPNNPNMMLQEYIPQTKDSMWMYNGYFDKYSYALAAFTGKKIRQNPVYTGMTSLGVCSWNETVAGMTEMFFKAIGYRGIVDVDYCFDSRSNQYKIVDINPRIGATFRLFVARNGIDVALAMYLDLTGQSVPRSISRDGRKWIVEDKDLLSSYRYVCDRKLTVSEWLSSLHGINEAGYFDIRDPGPFGRMVWNHCKRRLLKLRRKELPKEAAFGALATVSRTSPEKKVEQEPEMQQQNIPQEYSRK